MTSVDSKKKNTQGHGHHKLERRIQTPATDPPQWWAPVFFFCFRCSPEICPSHTKLAKRCIQQQQHQQQQQEGFYKGRLSIND